MCWRALFGCDAPGIGGTPVWLHAPNGLAHLLFTMTFRTLAPLCALFSLFSLFSLFFLTACDSSSDGSDELTMLRLDVETLAAGQPFQTGQSFTVDGRTGRLDIAEMYLSGITLISADGREIPIMVDEPITVRAKDENDTELQHTVGERYVLVDAGTRSPVMLGEVPSGNYTGVRFLLGVDGLDNRIAPEDAPSTHPLAPQEPSMHWNWNAGYVFLRLDGLLDIDGDGTVDASTGTPRDATSGQWRLHLGMTANATTVTLDQAFELKGGAQDLHVQMDLNRMVQGLDLSNAAISVGA